MESTKECRLCGAVKPISKYRVARRTRTCMACESERDRAKKRVDPRVYILEVSKIRANRLGREHNISIEDIVIPDRCPITGVPVFYTKGKATDSSPSLDRIDNSLGYVKGNVRIISNFANSVIKGSRSRQELIDFAKNLLAYLGAV